MKINDLHRPSFPNTGSSESALLTGRELKNMRDFVQAVYSQKKSKVSHNKYHILLKT